MKPTKPTSETLSPMFDRAASRYDWLNRLMSLGRDTTWRTALAHGLEPGERVLDLCCGSARSSIAAHRRTRQTVVGVDVSPGMLGLGVAQAEALHVPFVAVRADALRLPFPDASFDAVTVAWGLRNLSPEIEALAEMRRVLVPGGRLHVLDSPTPPSSPVGAAHRIYIRWLVPLLGRLSDDPAAYRYLSRSILAFGRVEEVARRLQLAGFTLVDTRRLFLGAAAVWSARKPEDGSAALRSATLRATAGQSARLAPPVS